MSITTRGRAALLISCTAALAVVVTAMTMFGGRTASPPLAATAAETATTGITVSGIGTATGRPDALRLSMGVQATAADVSTALNQANAVAAKVAAVLTRGGVKDADLQTSGLSIQPNYTSKGAPNGYQVTESLMATLRDLKTAGTLISQAATAGGNAIRIDGVSLDLSDDSALMTSARDKAFAQAKAKAEQYAKAAGRGLGAVTSISEVVNGATPSPYESAARDALGSQAVPIQAGSQKVSVNVTVVFGLA